MSHSAVVIGVDRTGGLPPLGGAVSGATEFSSWATDQDIATTLLTDEQEPLTVSEIQDAVETILDRRNCKKLIIYFAGHGFLLSPQVELWLLSKAPDRGQEAVNVALSLDHARYCGVEHVIFVSDACRSGGPTHQHRSVTGASIFPPPSRYDLDGKLDAFYATRPGDTALEYKEEHEAVDNYRGLFTETLLEALRGDAPDVVHEHADNGATRWLIPSDRLEEHLETAVPLKAEAIDIRLSQTPIVIPESRVPQYFGELSAAPSSGGRRRGSTAASGASRDVSAVVRGMQDEVMSFDDAARSSRSGSTETEQVFDEQMRRIESVRGRDHFETETGFTVFGPLQSAAVGGSWDAETFEADAGVHHVRIERKGDTVARSALLQFESGLGIVVAVKRGFIGTVLLEDDQVVNVNYTPSANTPEFAAEYEDAIDRIERRRAFAATATRHGVFQIAGEEAADAGAYLRMEKKLDPTLGLYAAYAYHLAGKIESIRNVAMHMEDDGLVLFDVMLLGREDRTWPAVGPFCPMLRQGWALLSLHSDSAEDLAPLQGELVPGLWATFTPDGVTTIERWLDEGRTV